MYVNSDLYFPKLDDYEVLTQFPELVSFTGKSKHPALKLIKDGTDIESLTVLDDYWTDDGLYCFNLIIRFDGKNYGCSLLWLDLDDFKILAQAETGVKKYVDLFKEYVLDLVDD